MKAVMVAIKLGVLRATVWISDPSKERLAYRHPLRLL